MPSKEMFQAASLKHELKPGHLFQYGEAPTLLICNPCETAAPPLPVVGSSSRGGKMVLCSTSFNLMQASDVELILKKHSAGCTGGCCEFHHEALVLSENFNSGRALLRKAAEASAEFGQTCLLP